MSLCCLSVYVLNTLVVSGMFDVISNLGSLAARFIFLPIEDSAYLLFSQTLKRGTPASEQPKVLYTFICTFN